MDKLLQMVEQMTEAMLAGDIDISYSQGLTPFVNAVKC